MKRAFSYEFLDGARSMPPLYHSIPGKQFDIDDSEVCDWLMSDPNIRQKIFDMASRKKVIVFDPETGKWKGADHD